MRSPAPHRARRARACIRRVWSVVFPEPAGTERMGIVQGDWNGRKPDIHLENLEKRLLFSNIQVADYGAVPDDGGDDRAAIQAAINDAGANDTVRFGSGQYDIN